MQHFVHRMGIQTVGVNTAFQHGIGITADRQIHRTERRDRNPFADTAIFTAEIVAVQKGHAAPVHIAVFRHHHHAGYAAVQAVDRMEGRITQIVGHGACHGDGFLCQGGRVDRDTGGFIQNQQIIVLEKDVQRIIHRNDVGT